MLQKKIININEIDFELDLNEGKICFLNDHDEIIDLKLEKDNLGNINKIQNLKIPNNKYLEIKFEDKLNSNLINRIELCLIKDNILLNTDKSFFNFNNKSLHLETFKLDNLKNKNLDLQVNSINKNLTEKTIEINYTLNSNQIKKIKINYEIDTKNQIINLKNLNNFNQQMIKIYYEPFKLKINQAIVEQLNQIVQAKDQNMYVENFDINLFENNNNQIEIKDNSDNLIANKKASNNLIEIVLGVLIPILFITISLIIYVIKKKKQKIK